MTYIVWNPEDGCVCIEPCAGNNQLKTLDDVRKAIIDDIDDNGYMTLGYIALQYQVFKLYKDWVVKTNTVFEEQKAPKKGKKK